MTKEELMDLLSDPDVMAKVEFITRRVVSHEMYIRQKKEENEPSSKSAHPSSQ